MNGMPKDVIDFTSTPDLRPLNEDIYDEQPTSRIPPELHNHYWRHISMVWRDKLATFAISTYCLLPLELLVPVAAALGQVLDDPPEDCWLVQDQLTQRLVKPVKKPSIFTNRNWEARCVICNKLDGTEIGTTA